MDKYEFVVNSNVIVKAVDEDHAKMLLNVFFAECLPKARSYMGDAYVHVTHAYEVGEGG